MTSQIVSLGGVKYRNVAGVKIPPRGAKGRDEIIQQKLENKELVKVGEGRKGRVPPNKGKSCSMCNKLSVWDECQCECETDDDC